MTEPTSRRIKDLPPAQAIVLHRIHDLAARGTELRRARQNTAPGTPESAQLTDNIDTADRDRALTEIRARSTSVPVPWIDYARRTGQTGRPWDPDRLLPTPQPSDIRASPARVDSDMRRIADMAALTAAREHQLATAGTIEPEPAAAQQLRRNMAALHTRAIATADAHGLPDKLRRRIARTASAEAETRALLYRDYTPDDLDTEWRNHATIGIADNARQSIRSLRRTGRGVGVVPSAGADLTAPGALVEHARRALGTAEAQPGEGMDAAIAAALPQTLDTEVSAWDSQQPHAEAPGHSVPSLDRDPQL
ncbi:hypothetical protein [Nocardia sp. NPDC057227]|uniref:hypothetical protein n=1 Tax=Nocardia sp. NPDC057227 TaxID=3346056 RepID=UPI0036288B6D